MKLILHIGGAKCGSSAVQHALAENRGPLQAGGVLVPGSQLDAKSAVSGNQIGFFRRVVQEPDGPAIVRARLQALHREMSGQGLKTLVVSAENLINQNRYPELFEGIEELFDLQIVAYVRRQDDYLVSAWQQWALKVYPSVQRFLDARMGKDANWAEMLSPWEERYGRDRIRVRRFQRESLIGADVIEDFFATVGLSSASLARSKGLYNRSWNEHVGELGHRIRDVFEDQHDNRFFDDLRYAVGPAVFKDYSGSMLFSLEQRRAILDAYRECNANLRATYFQHLAPDEPLFRLPSEDDVVTLDELERLRGQQDLLVRAVVRLAQKVRHLEQQASQVTGNAGDGLKGAV